MTQPSLFATRDADAAARLTAAFLGVLADGHWHLRRELCRRIPGLTERAARLIAEHSGGSVIGSAKGYKLLRYATTEEADRAERTLTSQGRKMIDRAREIRIARNRSGAAA